ncbi:hypothetical protein JCM11491_006758 [Sporobolomyces phaffii]
MASPERAQTPLLQYFPSVKPEPSATSTSSVKPKISHPPRYSSLSEATKRLTTDSDAKGKGQNTLLNKAIRNTLGKDDNPVTNSTSYGRTMHIQSCATGHQGGGGGKGWAVHRYAKLALQAAEKESDILKGVVACISGYTGPDSTNLELKECVQRQGGKMLITPNGSCTHIFSTSNLSGSKAQKYFESNKKNKYKLVLPDWAYECERVGRRVCESRFVAPIKHEAQESIFEIYRSDQPATSTSAVALLATPSLASTSLSTSKRMRERSHSPRLDLTAGDSTIVLSPSPSPKSPQVTKKRRSNTTSTVAKKTSKKTKDRKSTRAPRISEENKVEELLILGSSDVEIEDPVLAAKQHRPLKQLEGETGDAEEDELDDFGMPPSAQRR